ncbi:hypothetical protein SRABI106_02562 [Rahnella aquatilis]|nr:hypothetical protein SRABI106_02562 [Rahnella aquatilis]
MSETGLNAGDVLLINSGSWCNIAGQFFLRKGSSVNTTHVALSLGNGIFIHADKRCGVDLVFFSDLIDKSNGNWKVIRHIEIKDVFEKKIKEAGVFHLNKAYSFGFVLKENETSMFCSQFVDLVYKTIGINIFNLEASKKLINLNNAFPVDFERLVANDKRWIEVTKIYLDAIDDNFIEHLKPHFQMECSLILISRNMRKDHSFALNLLHTLNDSHNLLPDEHKSMELEIHLSEMIKDINNNESDIFYDFWNKKSKRFKKGN